MKDRIDSRDGRKGREEFFPWRAWLEVPFGRFYIPRFPWLRVLSENTYAEKLTVRF